jgi:hypothetical protein
MNGQCTICGESEEEVSTGRHASVTLPRILKQGNVFRTLRDIVMADIGDGGQGRDGWREVFV